MGKNGGTKIYCPSCEEIQICEAIPVPHITYDSSDYSQRMYLTNHPDLNFFQRGRRCKASGEEFITAEIEYEFLMELSNLRIALKDIKENAEIYNKQTVDAQKTLQKLQKSLSLLQALK